MRLFENAMVFCAAYLCMQSSAVAFTVSPEFDARKISVKLQSAVKYLKSTERFTYTYTISCAAGEYETLNQLAIKTDSTILNPYSPSGWSGMKIFEKPYWAWIPDTDDSDFPPGSSVSNLKFESHGLPAVQPYFAQGIVNLPNIDDIPIGVSERDFSEALDVFHNGISGSTVGPSDRVVGIGVISILRHIRTQLEESSKAGWISNHGIMRSLEARLDSTEKSITSGNSKSAISHLNSFNTRVTRGCLNGLPRRRFGTARINAA